MTERNYCIEDLNEIPPTSCPCGTTRRAFVNDESQLLTTHLLEISVDSKVHYHKKITEVYVILEGEGHMELDGEKIAVKPMSSILIKPGCRHRAVGKLKVLLTAIPAFNPEDEWFDE
ncbi:MAG: cupin domain-containing protein [Lentisphaeria bacterium]|nr:cupin domain-containing protein [Lentisphaeria bacterium]NQZ69480.1 cupin domain-containing protein [Lentisphaeria bacterium]